MTKLNLQLSALFLIPLLILGGVIWYGYSLYTNIKALQAQVAVLSDVSTSTSPLIQLGNGIVTSDLQALCLATGHPTICQRVGMEVSQPQVPAPALPTPSPQK